jgi:hypothetical protein
MAKVKEIEEMEAPAAITNTPGKRGRKALPPNPREAFLQIVQGNSGPVVGALHAAEALGRVSRATCPNPDGEGRVRVEYSVEDVNAIEEAVMEAFEQAFVELRERPPAAKSGLSFRLS